MTESWQKDGVVVALMQRFQTQRLPRAIELKKKVAICQGIGMARKLGWAVAMGKEDMQCALGAADNLDPLDGDRAIDAVEALGLDGKTLA